MPDLKSTGVFEPPFMPTVYETHRTELENSKGRYQSAFGMRLAFYYQHYVYLT